MLLAECSESIQENTKYVLLALLTRAQQRQATSSDVSRVHRWYDVMMPGGLIITCGNTMHWYTIPHTALRTNTQSLTPHSTLIHDLSHHTPQYRISHTTLHIDKQNLHTTLHNNEQSLPPRSTLIHSLHTTLHNNAQSLTSRSELMHNLSNSQITLHIDTQSHTYTPYWNAIYNATLHTDTQSHTYFHCWYLSSWVSVWVGSGRRESVLSFGIRIILF